MVTIDIEHMDGIFHITCHNEYGVLRQCVTDEQVIAVGFDNIMDDVEYMFFKELFKTDL